MSEAQTASKVPTVVGYVGSIVIGSVLVWVPLRPVIGRGLAVGVMLFSSLGLMVLLADVIWPRGRDSGEQNDVGAMLVTPHPWFYIGALGAASLVAEVLAPGQVPLLDITPPVLAGWTRFAPGAIAIATGAIGIWWVQR